MIIPIVTLDKIFVDPDNKNIYFLDCTRLDGTTKLISRKKESLDYQIEKLSLLISSNEIVITDDVVFSGSVLNYIINKFELFGIKVVKIISSICTKKAYLMLGKKLKYGIETNILLEEDVIDQVCERDFYFGIAGSGIMVKVNEEYKKAPYFKPYGNPYKRSSVPIEYENYFSIGCLERSIYLWEKIDNLKGNKTFIEELPEKIIYTDEKDLVAKTLRKERKKICESYKSE